MGSPLLVSVDSDSKQFPAQVRAVQAANLGDPSTPEGATLADVARTSQNNKFAARTSFGPNSTNSERNPFGTIYSVAATAMDSKGGHGGDFVAHAQQTVFTGDFTGMESINPGYVWGRNSYTTTGKGSADGNGIGNFTGELIEASISSGAEANIYWVSGLQAEAAFIGSQAAAHVNSMFSIRALAPKRKDGATGGDANSVYSLWVDAARVGDAGSTTAYSLWVDGGLTGIKGQARIVPETGVDPFLVRNDGNSSSVFRIDNGGNAYAGQFATLASGAAVLREKNSGGELQLSSQSPALSAPGAAGKAVLGFVSGTTAGTLKLVVRAGSGAQTTVLDNIPQS
ncbi:hypothetical protein KK092_04070 [Curtobacterium flaccumfaciens pv. flaccumfaciens]|uniref:hypothetical protein n=1 Tax=Curtobacterium flaccumfaciens TaxID=2035 RepID=UPI001BDE447D|nr:hypothetical protein [Curtobacterium flaccumfaciens]MBT1668549.1 hypothetical protein [Curtobacterium flaccumfaciens pv. flaccumfaciens]